MVVPAVWFTVAWLGLFGELLLGAFDRVVDSWWAVVGCACRLCWWWWVGIEPVGESLVFVAFSHIS